MTEEFSPSQFEYPKFDNVFGELDFYKRKCEELEKDLFKSMTQNKKNDMNIKKLQDMISVYGKNVNNTSNSFLLPSEFKSNFETLAKDMIMEGFDSCFDDYQLLSNLVQDSLRIIYEDSNSTIISKINISLKSLGIEEPFQEKFLIKFRIIFQEYFTTIFTCTEEFILEVKNKMEKLVDEFYIKQFNSKIVDIKSDLNTKGFKTFVSHSFKICIYMLLHDPQLTFNILPFHKRQPTYIFYNKSDFLNIEGFGKEQTPCVIILPTPIMRSKFPYQGIKPAVYMVVNADDNIKQECEKNKVHTPKARSYSSAELTSMVNNMEGIGLINNNNNLENPVANNPLNTKRKMHRESSLQGNQDSNKNSPQINLLKPLQAAYEKPLAITGYKEKSPSTVSNNSQASPLVATTTPHNSTAKLCTNFNQQNQQNQQNQSNQNNSKKSSINLNENGENILKKSPQKEIQSKESTPLIEAKNYRSNSHNNVKNPSRNSSILESFNNSINKESVRTNDSLHQQGAVQKSQRGKAQTPLIENELDNLITNSAYKKEQEYLTNDKAISNSFSMIRPAKNDKVNQMNNKENIIRLNLNNYKTSKDSGVNINEGSKAVNSSLLNNQNSKNNPTQQQTQSQNQIQNQKYTSPGYNKNINLPNSTTFGTILGSNSVSPKPNNFDFSNISRKKSIYLLKVKFRPTK
jgi:hypothetical protein